jgi:hypothetical protein
MYCHHCGNKIADQTAQFCGNCGTRLALVKDQEIKVDEEAQHLTENTAIIETISLEKQSTEEPSRINNRKVNRAALLWPIVVPVISLLLGGGSAFAYYDHQTETNKEVLFLKEKAEKDALRGRYTQALSSLHKAEKLRPGYKVLKKDEGMINKALQLDKALEAISNSLKTQQIDKADTQIAQFKELLAQLQGPLFSPFHKQIDEKSTILAVAKIKGEINNLKTVEQLADKLTALSSLQAAESEEVKRLILAKIVDLSTKDAETKLSDNQFTDALSTIDKALEYAANDSKLLSFKERIQNEQTAFEKAEQQRIQKAIEVAAQEDLNNHTAAVSVDNLNVYTDEYGDLHISGDIINRATVPISSIKLYYTVYDTNGISLGSDFTYADPFWLEPGQNGSFEAYHYGVNQDTTVKIERITWQLN